MVGNYYISFSVGNLLQNISLHEIVNDILVK